MNLFGPYQHNEVGAQSGSSDGPVDAVAISFDESFLSICAPHIKEKLLEKSKMFSKEVLFAVKEGCPNTVEKIDMFRKSIIHYMEALLRNIFATYQSFYCPDVSSMYSYDAAAIRQFDCNLVKRRLECVIKCTVECVSQMPGWLPSFFSLEQTSEIITTISAFVYFLLIFPTFNFVDGSPNYYEARSSDVASNDVRRFYGFWLNYFNNMELDFTEMGLLLALSVNQACRYLNTTVYNNRFNRAEEIVHSTLMTYCLNRKFADASPSATDRWIMLNRNLNSIFRGIFEGGKLSFAEIGSKLVQRTPHSFQNSSDDFYSAVSQGVPTNGAGAGSSQYNQQFSSDGAMSQDSMDVRSGEESMNNDNGSDQAASASPMSSSQGSGNSCEYPTSPEDDNRSLSD